MKYRFLLKLFLGLLYLSFLSACDNQAVFIQANEDCIAPFDVFAYQVPENPNSPDRMFYERVLPKNNWITESTIPEYVDEPFARYTVEETRTFPEYVEVWIRKHTQSNAYFYKRADEYKFLVYRTDTKTWITIPSEIENSGVFVKSLYVLEDNTIFGNIVWDWNSEARSQYVLSRYNDEMQNFKFEGATQNMPAFGIDDDGYYPWSKILLENENLFWIFAPFDSIYTYNPYTNEIINRAKFPDYYVIDVAMAHNEGIFIVIGGSKGFRLKGGDLLFYNLQTNEIENIKLSLNIWPHINSLLVDQNDNLWLDAVGWRSQSGTWHKLHSQTWDYIWKMNYNHAWSWYIPPRIVLESSDGRMWFASGLNDTDRSGLAWIDPKTYESCWFTNIGNTIVEDKQYTLWVVADGKLYRSSIDP